MSYPPAVYGLLEECAEVSRTIGSNPFMTLHGGGNTSVKTEDVLYVKASGFDLAALTPEGLAPLSRHALAIMLERDHMSDTELVEGYRAARLEPGPAPSIEALLHNFLPHRFVLHSHADAIVTLTNALGADHVALALGVEVLRLPYSMPGFELAQTIREAFAARSSQPLAIVQDHHGLFTYADDADEARALHECLVDRAQSYIFERTGVAFADDDSETRTLHDASGMVALSDQLREFHDGDIYYDVRSSARVDEFLARADLAEVTQRGGASLEHVIRTKRWPMIGVNVPAFAHQYLDYFDRNSARYDVHLTMLDVLPRVALIAGTGLVGIGRTEKEASIAADIYRHTMRIIEAASLLGGYQSVTEQQSFDIEYWELEQVKLR
ncbi:class II aldolase/adducin family protein [Timonella sp. A28]|uniref:class II aldolase/adducin family protein n=1 Tax=Timonella sp. A28 TaxID=3442640 RepID=UPI003EBFE172